MSGVLAFWRRSSISGKLTFTIAVLVAAGIVVLSVVAMGLGGLGLLIVPAVLVGIAFLLRAGPVWSRLVGVVLAGLLMSVALFASAEEMGLVSLSLVATAAVVLVAGFVDLVRTMIATGFWKETPPAGRLAFTGAVYWAVIFQADSYLSANLSIGRVLFVPFLFVAILFAAFFVRSRTVPTQVTGLALAGLSVLVIGFAWATNPELFTLSAPSWAGVPGSDYWTRMPWPPVLMIGILLELAIVVLGALRLAHWSPPNRLRTAL